VPVSAVPTLGIREGQLADHLTPAASYTFTVQAHDFSGNTATSNAVTVTTEASSDVTPPSAPTNVRIVETETCGFTRRITVNFTTVGRGVIHLSRCSGKCLPGMDWAGWSRPLR
jgi:hypothetical protein